MNRMVWIILGIVVLLLVAGGSFLGAQSTARIRRRSHSPRAGKAVSVAGTEMATWCVDARAGW